VKADPRAFAALAPLSLLLTAPFAAPAPAPAASPAKGAADERLDVRIDERLEALFVVRCLAPGRAEPEEEKLRRRFAKLRSHPAVKLDAGLSRSVFHTHARYDYLVKLDHGKDLNLWDLPEAAALGGDLAKVDDWAKAVRAFARTPEFRRYLGERAAALEPTLAKAREELRANRMLSRLEEYTGLPLPGDHLVVPTPFERAEIGGGFASPLRLRPRYLIVNAVAEAQFAASSRGGLAALIWHEAAHGTADPLAHLHEEELAASAGLFERIEPGRCRGDWTFCVKEHVNDAIALRLVSRLHGERDLVYLLPWKEADYPHLSALLERLKEYEANRDKYPTLVEFYPRLLAAFPRARAKRPAEKDPSMLELVARTFREPAHRAQALALASSAVKSQPSAERFAIKAALEILLERPADAEASAKAALALEPKDERAAELLKQARAG